MERTSRCGAGSMDDHDRVGLSDTVAGSLHACIQTHPLASHGPSSM